MSHTPGPWEISVVHDREYNVPMYEIDNVAEKSDEVDANACLIAAAPDLLVALKHAHAILIDESIGYRPDDCPHCALIRAAIAKAEGQS